MKFQFQQCNCLAVRQAARRMTQFYDRFLASTELTAPQFSILAALEVDGPLTINRLAEELVMDRTTLGRNILPLERDDWVEIAPGTADRRTKMLQLSKTGAARFRVAASEWAKAQAQFEEAFGRRRSAELRGLLREVVSNEL